MSQNFKDFKEFAKKLREKTNQSQALKMGAPPTVKPISWVLSSVADSIIL